jgi:hypothetical protein
MPALSDARIRAAKPKEKGYKLFDSLGLYMKIEPTGGRLWRFKYKINGVEKLLSLGLYPDVPLKRAREKRDEARRLVADGIDPSIQRKAEKAAKADTFQAISLEWLELHRKKFAPATFEKGRMDVQGPYQSVYRLPADHRNQRSGTADDAATVGGARTARNCTPH